MSSIISTSKQKGDLYLASSLCDGIEDKDLNQLTILLKHKDADPNVLMPIYGVTPFHLIIGNDSEAFAEEGTKLFLQYGGNPNVQSVEDMTPVHVAAAWGRNKILELLLANGGDPLSLDSDGCSPFQYAFQGQHYESVQVLTKYCVNDKSLNKTNEPRFKLELNRVLLTNGEIVGEYITPQGSSDNSNFSNDLFLEKSSKTDYERESSSSDIFSSKTDFVTKRKIAKDHQNGKTYHHVHSYCDYDNIRKESNKNTTEDEINLINELLSQLSSSVVSDKHSSSKVIDVDNQKSSMQNETAAIKKKKIKMAFNRPSRNKKAPRILDKHTRAQQQISFKRGTEKEAFVSKEKKGTKKLTPNTEKMGSLRKSILQTPTHENSFNAKEWFDETILSKSPNLMIRTAVKNKRNFLGTPSSEEKVGSKKSIVSRSLTNCNSNCSPNQRKVFQSKIPIPKKYFTTPGKLETNTKNSFPVNPNFKLYDDINNSIKISESDKSKQNINNGTSSKSELSSPSFLINSKDPERHMDQNDKFISRNEEHFNDSSVNYFVFFSPNHKDKRSFVDTKYDSQLHLTKSIKEEINTLTEDSWNQNLKNKSSSRIEKESTDQFSRFDIISGIELLESKSDSKSNLTESKQGQSFSQTESKLNGNYVLNSNLVDKTSKTDISKKITHMGDLTFNSIIAQRSNESALLTLDETALPIYDYEKDSSKSCVIEKKNNECSEYKKAKDFESNLIIPGCKENSFNSSKKIDSETFMSMEEMYKYEDLEEGVVLFEKRLCVTPSCASSEASSSYYSCSTAKSEALPKELYYLDNVTLRDRLKVYGVNAGPITNTTHHLYLKRLHKLEAHNSNNLLGQNQLCKSPSKNSDIENGKQGLKSSLLSIEWIKDVDEFETIERKVFLEFDTPNPTRKWREGTCKSSFNYILLDSRITIDLPRRAAELSLSDKWKTFLSAIFYVGKGKRSRPYAHLYDAFKIWVDKDQRNTNSTKIQRILDIWNEGKGVVVLHVFHNTIPVEAYTREALMIEALGTEKLGNCKIGDYYGVAATWKQKEKCELGKYLLFKALQIFLIEGERQIFPDNL